MMPVLGQRILVCLGAVHEYAAKSAIPFADNPVTVSIFADDDG